MGAAIDARCPIPGGARAAAQLALLSGGESRPHCHVRRGRRWDLEHGDVSLQSCGGVEPRETTARDGMAFQLENLNDAFPDELFPAHFPQRFRAGMDGLATVLTADGLF